MPRSFLKKSTFLFLCVIGVYIGGWKIAAIILEKKLQTQIEALQSKGIQLTYESFKISGFPFRCEAVWNNPHFSQRPSGDTIFKVKGDLRAGLSWPSYFQKGGIFTVSTQGRSTFIFGSKLYGNFRIGAKSLEATIDIPDKKEHLPPLKLTAHGASFQTPLGESQAETLVFENSRVLESSIRTLLKFSFKAHNLDPGFPLPKPFDQKVKIFHLRGRFDLNNKKFPLNFPRLIRAFSQEGGTIELENADVEWGEINLRANGTFTLDELKQPIASFSARIIGLEGVLNGLVTQGVLTKGAAQLSGLALDFFKKPSPQDKSEAHEVSLTLQNGELSLGPVTLFRFPPLRWEGE